jgi:hypothetical protein
VLAGGSRDVFVPNTPNRLRAARTCYDHLAGTLGVSLHDRFTALRWLNGGSTADNTYLLTPAGQKVLPRLALISRELERCEGDSRTRAWIGASEDLTLAGRWLRRS